MQSSFDLNGYKLTRDKFICKKTRICHVNFVEGSPGESNNFVHKKLMKNLLFDHVCREEAKEGMFLLCLLVQMKHLAD